LLDRIDLHVEVPRLPAAELRGASRSESSVVVASRVAAARQRQHARQGRTNASLPVAELTSRCCVATDATAMLERAVEQLGLSARSYHRVLRVALTIADLADAARIDRHHVAEALSWRPRPRASASAVGSDDCLHSCN
jgi:magnesium chelatase family protein